MVNKEELFEYCPVPKAVARLALPTIASSLVMIIYSLADTFFVGMLNDPLETSAVTLAAPVLLLFNAVNNLFGVGCASIMSRSLGVKDYDTVRRSSAFGIYSAILSGALFSALALIFSEGLLDILGAAGSSRTVTSGYLFWTVICGAVPSILNVVMSNLVRAEGNSLLASIGTISGCLLNIVLDPFFILPFGLGLGAAGAGFATFISNLVASAYYIVLLIIIKDRTYISFRPANSIPDRNILKNVFGVGIPASIQNILNVTGMTILNNLTAVYGPEAVSAVGIAHKVALIPLYFSMGGGQGIMPLVGYNYASGNRGRLKETVRFAEKASVIITVVFTAAIYFYSSAFIRVFMENPLIVEYGSGFLRGFALAVPFLGLDFLAVAIFQACGLGRKSLEFAIARKIILEIPAIIILNRVFGMYGLAYGQLAAEFILSIAAVATLEKILKSS